MDSYNLLLIILMMIMFTTAVAQLFQHKFNAYGIVMILAGLSFVMVTARHGDLEMLSVLLFLSGAALMILELFVIGMILGVIGGAMVLTSFLLIGEDIGRMAMYVALCLIISVIEWVVIVKFFGKKVPLFNKVILTDATTKEAGYTSHDDRSYLLNQTALTATPLRPSGIITFGDERIDAVSDGAFIDKNKYVSIIFVEGTRVVVREIEGGN